MYIAALPKAWTRRKRIRRNPVDAIIIFLPIEDLTNETNHMSGHLAGKIIR
jgi:hypothetical protein